MAKIVSVEISVSFVPRKVVIKAVNDADDKEYTYVGESFKRLQEVLDKLSATFQDTDAESFEQNVATDGSRKLLAGP